VRDAQAVEKTILASPGRVQNALLFTTAYLPIQSNGGVTASNTAGNTGGDAAGATAGSNGGFDANTTVGYILMFNGTVASYPYYGNNHAVGLGDYA
jgi:hypothetical protein